MGTLTHSYHKGRRFPSAPNADGSDVCKSGTHSSRQASVPAGKALHAGELPSEDEK